MKLTESHLRNIIRQELIKEMNFGQKGEAAINLMFDDYEMLDDLLERPMTYQEMANYMTRYIEPKPSVIEQQKALTDFIRRIKQDGYTIKDEGGGKVSIQSPVYGGGGLSERKKRN